MECSLLVEASLAPTFELPLNTVDNTLSDSVALPSKQLPECFLPSQIHLLISRFRLA